MRAILIIAGLALSGCAGDATGSDSSPGEQTAACAEVDRLETEECLEMNCLQAEPQTCSYGSFLSEGDDCGCMTLYRLMVDLCEAGNSDSLETLEAGIVCVP